MKKNKKNMIVAISQVIVFSSVLGFCCVNSVGKLIKAQFATHQEVVIEKLFWEEHQGRREDFAEVYVDNATQKVYIRGKDSKELEEGDTLEVVFVDGKYSTYDSIKSLAGNNVGVTCMALPFVVGNVMWVVKRRGK